VPGHPKRFDLLTGSVRRQPVPVSISSWAREDVDARAVARHIDPRNCRSLVAALGGKQVVNHLIWRLERPGESLQDKPSEAADADQCHGKETPLHASLPAWRKNREG